MTTKKSKSASILNSAVLIGALGYFVDIYDLILFSIVRVPSLKGIGVPDHELLDTGVTLLNSQMFGMLLGGILWGILGDKKGRLKVLLGSIFLYSVANILNGFVTSVGQYATLRFIAGVGLAGELGAAITLVSEVLPKEKRGVGTTIVATVGVCGALVASTVADLTSWKVSYVVGGCLGLALLALRISVSESKMFETCASKTQIARGNLLTLIASPERLQRYICCILIGLPIWYVLGILVTFSPELSTALQVQGQVNAGKSVFYAYTGFIIGDFASGMLSQLLKSRKRAVFLFIALTAASILFYLKSMGLSVGAFYWVCTVLGIAAGYWAVFVTIAAEQFGTNLRATVTTSVPNFIRGSTVLITLAFKDLKVVHGPVSAALWVGITTVIIAFLALLPMRETFGKDLNYFEH